MVDIEQHAEGGEPVRLGPAKTANVVRVSEDERVRVAARPSGREARAPVASSVAAEAHPRDPGLTVDGDAFLSAVTSGMLAVALADGPASEAGLRALELAVADRGVAAIASSRAVALARADRAGDLSEAKARFAAVAPSLPEERRAAALDMLFLAAAGGGWKVMATWSVVQLAGALGFPPDDVYELVGREQVVAV